MNDSSKKSETAYLMQPGTRPRHAPKEAPAATADASPKATADANIGTQSSQSTSAEQEDEAQKTRREVLYDWFAEKSRELFEAGQDKGRETFDKAMEKAARAR